MINEHQQSTHRTISEMSAAYKLTIPEDFPLSDEDPMESDLELTPTPRKPPTEWWLCWDLLEMVGKDVLAVRKRRTIQYWHDITAQKDYLYNSPIGPVDMWRSTFIINSRLTLKTMNTYIKPDTWDLTRDPGGIGRMCNVINSIQPPYKPLVIKSYPKSRVKKNKCSVCRRVGHNKRNCPRAHKS